MCDIVKIISCFVLPFMIAFFCQMFGLSPVASTIVADMFLIGYCVVLLRHARSTEHIRSVISAKHVILFLCFFFFVWYVSQCFAMALSQYDVAYSDYSNVISGSILPYIVLTCFIAPISEEMLYRGVVFSFLFKRSIWGAYAVSALLFALSHGTFTHLPVAIACGLLFCYVYSVTGNIVYNILLHVASNVLCMLPLPLLSGRIACVIHGILLGIILVVISQDVKSRHVNPLP